MNHETGITAYGLALPPRALRVEALAALRGADPAKLTIGLGCREMALCDESTDVAVLATRAAERALARWGGRTSDLGLLVVGTETAKDMSRPLSAFVAESLGLAGAIRSYEVKHACYGGTIALRNAVEWRASGAARGKAALVIAADVALYAPGDPGEATQGGGAVAMIVGAPDVASIELVSHAYAEPAFDFYRPVGEAYPRVDGKLSLDCYLRATERCFASFVEAEGEAAIEALRSVCFHVPFPKMVKKAVARLGESRGWDEARTAAFFEAKVEPTMRWNLRVGNAYTASLHLSVASALAGAPEGARLGAFSYGSGFGAELLLLRAGPLAAAGAYQEDVERDLQQRTLLDAAGYDRYRASYVPH